MTKMNPLEKDVKEAIKEILDRRGYFYFAPPTSMYGTNGISDILALKAGKFFAIEAKLKKKKGTALQERFGGEVMDHGGYYFLANQANVDNGEFEAWLDTVEAEF